MGRPLVVLLMPTKEQVYRDMAEPSSARSTWRCWTATRGHAGLLRRARLTCIDLLPIFQAHARAGEQLYYTTDIHLNPRGNAVLADALAEWLEAHPDVFEAAPPAP